MPLMDWDAYRQNAAQQARNLSAMPYVQDLSRVTDNKTINADRLYGNDRDPASAIMGAFRLYAGRAPSSDEVSAYSNAILQGMSIPDVEAAIATAFPKPVAGYTGQPAPNPFATMNNPLAALQGQFAGGLMGGASPNLPLWATDQLRIPN